MEAMNRSTTEALEVRAEWRHGKMSLAQFAERVMQFIAAFLDQCPDCLGKLRLASRDHEESLPVPPVFEDACTLIMRHAWDRKAHWSFVPTDAEEAPLPHSTSKTGYALEFSCAIDGSVAWAISIRAGIESATLPNYVSIKVPPGGNGEDRTFSRSLLALTIQNWWPDEAGVSEPDFDKLITPDRMSRHVIPIRVGWMTHTRRPGIHQILPQGTQVEDFGEDCAKLITLDGPRVRSSNQEQVSQALRIRDALQAGGMLNSIAHTPMAYYANKRDNPPVRTRRDME